MRPRPFVKWTVYLAAGVLLAASHGCGNTDQPQTPTRTDTADASKARTNPKTAASQTPVRRNLYVSAETLAQSHPLRADVARLTRAERRLREIELAPDLANSQKRVFLPAMAPADTTSTDIAPNPAEIQRLRNRLEADALKRLAAYTSQLRASNERALKRREQELMDAVQPFLYDAEARARAEADEFTLENLTQLALPLTNLTIQRDALQISLRMLGPGKDSAIVEQEIATLEREPDTKFISLRAHFEFALRRIARERADIERRFAEYREAADKYVADAVGSERTRRLAEVEQQMNALRLALQQATRARSGQARLALSEFDDVARGVQAKEPASSPGATEYVRQIAVDGAVNIGSVRQAAERIATQRQRLEEFIREDVREAVRDAARARNADVSFVSQVGRQDATAEVRQWLKPRRRDANGRAN